MSKQRPRTARREQERAAKKLVRDREKLAALVPGGSRERPIEVGSSAVIEPRVESTPCPQCEGRLQIREHASEGAGLRRVDVICRTCGAPRSFWYRLVSDEPN